MTTTTVQNTITDPAGSPIANVGVRITLIASSGGNIPGLTGSASVTAPRTVYTDNTGTWTAALVPNDQITAPTGTYYQVSESGYVSTIQVPTGGGPYNLAALLVGTPPSPTTAYLAASQKGAAGGVATLDGTGSVPEAQLGNAVAVALNGTVEGVRHEINFIPGANTTLTVADNPGAHRVDVTIASTGGGSGNALPALPLFNVESYGAVGDGTTDDGPAVLAAWNALIASGKDGLLEFPRVASYRVDVTTMIVHGSGDQYAAFPIPIIPHDSTHPMRVLGIIGPGPALVGRQYNGGSNVAGPQSTAIIKVTYNTPFAWSALHGLPSLFGGPDYDFATQGTANVHFWAQNIQIRQPDPPSLCNLNLESCQCATVDEYFADSSTFPDAASKPIYVTGSAILWPAPGNAAVVNAGRIGCWGYFAGIPFAEHLGATYVYAVRNWIGLPVRRGSDHFAHLAMTVIEENRFMIAGYDPSTTNGAVAVPSNNQMVIVVDCLDFEDFPAGTDTWTYTRTHGSHVYDPNNMLRGRIQYAGVNSGSTAPTGRTDNMIAVGGTSLACVSLLSGNVIALSQTGYAPVDPASTVPGAPTIGIATGGNASVSVAFTAPGSTGGAPILSYTATSSPGGLTGTGSSSPIAVNGLTNGTPYTFTVHATNANGSGAESAASNSVTPSGGAASIFTNQTPALTDANDGSPYTLGTLFTTNQNGQITGIRWYFPATLPSQPVIGLLYLWTSDTTGTELARKTFTSPTAGAWNSVTFDTPVSITSGTKYVAAAWTHDHYVATSGFFTGSSVTNGHLTAPADDSGTPVRNGRLDISGSTTGPSFPGTAASGNCFFVDVLFQ